MNTQDLRVGKSRIISRKVNRCRFLPSQLASTKLPLPGGRGYGLFVVTQGFTWNPPVGQILLLVPKFKRGSLS